MSYTRYHFDELPLVIDGTETGAVVIGASADFEWDRDAQTWRLDRCYVGDIRIDDRPDCAAIVESAQRYADENPHLIGDLPDIPNPNCEHRLTARELGIGEYAR